MNFQLSIFKFNLLILFLIFTILPSCTNIKSTDIDSVDVEEIADLQELSGLTNVSWSPDSKKFATSQEGKVQIWELEINKDKEYSINNLKELPAQTDGLIVSLAWAPDDSILIGGSNDGAWLWDPHTGNQVKDLELEYGTHSFTWSPDGNFMASSSNDGYVRIWDTANDWSLSQIFVSIPDTIREVTWSPDGKWIATTEENDVKLWDAETGELTQTLEGHKDIVGHIDWSPHSDKLASTSDDQSIIIWDTQTGSGQFILDHNAYVSSIAWAPNGEILASGSGDGIIHLWDPNTGDKITDFEGHSDSVRDLDWTNDNKFLASTALFEGAVRIWKIGLVQDN
jgi:WD40 repeat protein